MKLQPLLVLTGDAAGEAQVVVELKEEDDFIAGGFFRSWLNHPTNHLNAIPPVVGTLAELELGLRPPQREERLAPIILI